RSRCTRFSGVCQSVYYSHEMPEELCDFTAPDRLRQLVDLLTENGKNNNRFESFALLNTSKWILTGGFPKEYLRFYGFPSARPVYLFIVEVAEFRFPHIHARTPSGGHDSDLLEHGLKALLKELDPLIAKHGRLGMDADTTVREAFFKLQREGAPFETVYSGDFFPYYMNEQQRTDILKKEYAAPKGYEIGAVDASTDYKFIHAMWPYGAYAPEELTRERLTHLPSVCIRDADGNLVAWELTHSSGVMTHLFTVAEHRGRGLGALAENLLSQILIRAGLHVFKYVVDTNVNVVNSTNRHPFWSQWTTLNDEDEEAEKMMWTFAGFKYIG
ncbi:hypothetical protein PMAYCL1PPCAC_14807, partial [Pristionchus mayeri]